MKESDRLVEALRVMSETDDEVFIVGDKAIYIGDVSTNWTEEDIERMEQFGFSENDEGVDAKFVSYYM